MAIKEFENLDYDFAKKQKDSYVKRLRIFSVIFALCILLFACWSFFSSLDIFGTRTTQISQPIEDPQTEESKRIEENKAEIEAYSNVRIPYRDPNGRFVIDFSTPYVSSNLVVYIRKADEREKIIEEANDIISTAKTSVPVTNVMYINDF